MKLNGGGRTRSVSLSLLLLLLIRLRRTKVAVGDHHALKQVFVRYTTCVGCTTSGVEHNHASQDWVFPPRRSLLSIPAQNTEMKLIVDTGNDDDSLIIELAQGIWGIFTVPVDLGQANSGAVQWSNDQKPAAPRPWRRGSGHAATLSKPPPPRC